MGCAEIQGLENSVAGPDCGRYPTSRPTIMYIINYRYIGYMIYMSITSCFLVCL